MEKKRYIWILFCLWLCGPVGAISYVFNSDGLLGEDCVATIESVCEEIDAKSGVELAVVAVEQTNGADVFSYGVELFNHLGIGKSDVNTGVLLLWVSSAREVRIITGSGIEPILTDAVCAEIVYDKMIPLLREGYSDEAIAQGVYSIRDYVCDTEAMAELLLAFRLDDPEPYGIDFLMFVVAMIVLFQIGCVIWRPWCKACHRPMWLEHTEVHEKSTFRYNGNATRYFRCHKCGKETVQTDYQIWRKMAITQFILMVLWEAIKGLLRGGNRGGGGGGGGFGGGSTSGGGAGGRY